MKVKGKTPVKKVTPVRSKGPKAAPAIEVKPKGRHAKPVRGEKAVEKVPKTQPAPPVKEEPAPAPKRKRAVSAEPSTALQGDAPPRIEARLVFKGYSVPVDPADLGRTLGAADYGHGRGLMDQWPDGVWVALLHHLDLPADPLDREAAGDSVRRLVQRVWYEAIQPWRLKDGDGKPTKTAEQFDQRDEAAAARYVEKFQDVKEERAEKVERAKKAFANVARAASVYDGKKIKVLKKDHGARPGTKRAVGLDIIYKSKTTDEATAALQKAGCDRSFIKFAVSSGYVELV